MNYEFDSAVRGYHYYRRYWSPQENEILKCYHESGNPFDIFAIKTYSNQDPRVVGHLPQEISLITKYLLELGAEIEVQLTSSQYRSSPITQGGQENHVKSLYVCLLLCPAGNFLIDTKD